MTTGTGDTVSFTYDNLRRLQKETVTNARGAVLLRTAYDFATISGNQSSMQVRFRNVRLGNSDSVLEGNQYTYDGVGNITAISQSTGNYYPLVKYYYDELGQMVKEVYYDGEGDADSNITATYDYTYDTAGNILSVSKNDTVTKTYSYNDGAWRDLLTAVNGTAISYENGNPLNYYNGEKSYTNLTWVQGRQLASITTGGSTYTYSYDGDGIRTQKVVNGVTHTYVTQNGKVVRESYGNIVMDFIYDNAGNPFALRYSTDGGSSYATYYYVLNLQGDVVKLVRIYAGTTIQEYAEMASYTYNAWGEIVSSSGSMADINPLRYRGYYYDAETGFYYLQSRYYDPVNCRFISADALVSTGQGFVGYNMFAYCNNNPVALTDYSGHMPVRENLFAMSVCDDKPTHSVTKESKVIYYASMDDTAIAVGKDLNRLTSETNVEYACGIYEMNDGGNLQYYHGEIVKGEHAAVNVGPIFGEAAAQSGNLVAIVHSHPYCSGHEELLFSGLHNNGGRYTHDAEVALMVGTLYLAAPICGVLYKLEFAKDKTYKITPFLGVMPIDNTEYDCG